jgi:hypothetical protein
MSRGARNTRSGLKPTSELSSALVGRVGVLVRQHGIALAPLVDADLVLTRLRVPKGDTQTNGTQTTLSERTCTVPRSHHAPRTQDVLRWWCVCGWVRKWPTNTQHPPQPTTIRNNSHLLVNGNHAEAAKEILQVLNRDASRQT